MTDDEFLAGARLRHYGSDFRQRFDKTARLTADRAPDRWY
jgi:hypothetical protein